MSDKLCASGTEAEHRLRIASHCPPSLRIGSSMELWTALGKFLMYFGVDLPVIEKLLKEPNLPPFTILSSASTVFQFLSIFQLSFIFQPHTID
ncbi:uncharacterized protein Bfra_001621 [Botrytis fragariae]|uniref:Uncharacterized protein n=1 Tax=Botrytis fragariae TaxID=1964551 RepID=A0A8H6B153_9HELO|nr:uncharacterized protein Bfra_001621 [Botrytis fragariae]KAF5877255.1 hypothetical protein Bfra_001621 [Botrytis fragariae]